MTFFQFTPQPSPDSCCDVMTMVATAISACAAIASALIAGFALCFAYKEYGLHKKREEADVVSKFNERYDTDERIAGVVKMLMKYEEEKSKNSDGQSFKLILAEGNAFDRELFLRFFEELQVSMESGSINKDTACYMFAYYAILADGIPDFVEDFNGPAWQKFHKFASSMTFIAKKKGYFPDLIKGCC